MSFASMAAVALVVLTVTFGQYGYTPGGSDGEATRLVAQTDATPASTPVSDVEAASFRALAPADCTVAERTREDMLDVLSQLPSLAPTAQSVDVHPIDQATYDEVQAAYEEWQVCSTFLLTWQQAALESDEYLRNDLYLWLETGYVPFVTVEPYSRDTLNEILDGREAANAAGREEQIAYPFTELDMLFVIEPASAMVSSDGSRVWFKDRVLNGDGTSYGPASQVEYVLEDGTWRIDSISQCCG